LIPNSIHQKFGNDVYQVLLSHEDIENGNADNIDISALRNDPNNIVDYYMETINSPFPKLDKSEIKLQNSKKKSTNNFSNYSVINWRHLCTKWFTEIISNYTKYFEVQDPNASTIRLWMNIFKYNRYEVKYLSQQSFGNYLLCETLFEVVNAIRSQNKYDITYVDCANDLPDLENGDFDNVHLTFTKSSIRKNKQKRIRKRNKNVASADVLPPSYNMVMDNAKLPSENSKRLLVDPQESKPNRIVIETTSNDVLRSIGQVKFKSEKDLENYLRSRNIPFQKMSEEAWNSLKNKK
jgi:hypothetical protein